MKILKQICIILIIILTIVGCNVDNNTWEINASLPQKTTTHNILQAYLYQVDNDKTYHLIDSANIVNNKFCFSGTNLSKNIQIYSIKLDKEHGNGVITITQNCTAIDVIINKEYKSKYSGSQLQQDFSNYLQLKQEEVNLLKILVSVFNQKGDDTENIKELQKSYQKQTRNLLRKKLNTITQIKDSELSAYVALDEVEMMSVLDKKVFVQYMNVLSEKAKLTIYGKKLIKIVQNFSAYNLEKDSERENYEYIKENYNKLDKTNQESEYGIHIAEKIKNLEKLSYGKKAPELIAKTIDGKPFDLKNIKNKIVIIDFWASWCGPCRLENKNYKRLYKQFNNKGLTIVGYSLDTNKKKWKQAVIKDELKWYNISNLKEQHKDIVLHSYMIKAVPANLLLKDGIIIGRNIFNYELEDFLKITLTR